MWAIPDQGQIQDFGNAELRQYPSTILFRLGILSPLCLPRSTEAMSGVPRVRFGN